MYVINILNNSRKRKNSTNEKIVRFHRNSCEQLEGQSDEFREGLEILHGRDRWMSGISRLTGRFFLNRKHDDFTLAYPPPSINPANCSPYKFFPFPSFLPRARTYNAHDPPLPFTCPTHLAPSKKLAPLLSMLEQVDAAGIPNCGFVFPRRYLLFHAGVHGVNEEGKLEGWTDDDSPFSPLFLSLSPLLLLFFQLFFSPLLLLAEHSIRMLPFLRRSPMMNGYWNKVMPVLMLRNVSKLGKYDFLRRYYSVREHFCFHRGRLNVRRKRIYESYGIGFSTSTTRISGLDEFFRFCLLSASWISYEINIIILE